MDRMGIGIGGGGDLSTAGTKGGPASGGLVAATAKNSPQYRSHDIGLNSTAVVKVAPPGTFVFFFSALLPRWYLIYQSLL